MDKIVRADDGNPHDGNLDKRPSKASIKSGTSKSKVDFFAASKEPTEGKNLLCLSHLRWDFVWQRPQHLMSQAARTYRVHFWEEPKREQVAVPALQSYQTGDGIRVLTPIIPEGMTLPDATFAQRRLLDEYLATNGDNGIDLLWYYTPLALSFTKHLEANIVVYDNMDELSAFRGASPELLTYESTLFDRADLVFTGGASLHKAKRSRHPRVYNFPSSVDSAHFRSARGQIADPQDFVRIPHPRIGYFGVIDERLDYDLLSALADLRTDWAFVMIGPFAKVDPLTLPRRQNIHWLGARSYCELPVNLGCWDVGFMPFALNEATRFISPTKTPEFLAAGLPIVSTPIADVIDPYGTSGLVEIANTAEQFAFSIERLMHRPRKKWLSLVDRHLEQISWTKTWLAMHEHIASRAARSLPASQANGTYPGLKNIECM